MDPRFLKHYDTELQHIREMGSEFARDFPKIAGRLGLEGFRCEDPYVERLLEGFAFLAARVQLKLDSEFPQLVQNLLEIVYPHFLAPMPSMAIVRFAPDLTEGGLAEGYLIPRDTVLRSQVSKGEQTACEYRTSHDVELWPIELSRVDYFSRDAANIELPVGVRDAEAGLRLRLRVAPGNDFSSLAVEKLVFYLQGREELPVTLYELCMAHTQAVMLMPVVPGEPTYDLIDKRHIRPLGFDSAQSLLPYGHASFQGYRLLSEYFAFRERFLFVEIGGIGDGLRRCETEEVDLILLLSRDEPGFSRAVDRENVQLNCTPAINLFPRRTDAIHVDNRKSEHHIVPDRTRPLDLEIYQINRVVGLGENAEEKCEFSPFYSLTDQTNSDHRAFYSIRRTPHVISRKHRRFGTESSYLGTEIYLSLVDRDNAPYSEDLHLLFVESLCTHRDLPIRMQVGLGKTDFTLEVGAPVKSVRCVAGPTPPRPSLAHASGEMIWKLLSHLGLNYLSIIDEGNEKGAAALRSMLRLYGKWNDSVVNKQIDGVHKIQSKPIIRKLPTTGPMVFGRGLEISLTLDEESFEGVGVFLFGAVLEEFFAKYVSINSFTETVLHTLQRQEVMRWPMRTGRRQIL